MNSYSPVAVFVYKRPGLTRQTIESLKRNPEAPQTDLIIFSDAARNEKDIPQVNEVREYVKSITGFKSLTVYESEVNLGLAGSIIKGVTEVVNKYGSIIVLEDDMIVSPYFLKYMNEGLTLYKDEEKVISIHAYVYPVKGTLPETFFLKGADCWGWGTWQRGWKLFNPDAAELLEEIEKSGSGREFDFNSTFPNVRMLKNQMNGKVDSWAIRWYASAFLAGKLTLYPSKSLVRNIGMGEEATHTKTINIYDVKLSEAPVIVEPIVAEENNAARKQFENFHRSTHPGLLNKVFNRFLHN